MLVLKLTPTTSTTITTTLFLCLSLLHAGAHMHASEHVPNIKLKVQAYSSITPNMQSPPPTSSYLT